MLTPKQLELYYQQCARKNEIPKDLDKMSSREQREELDRILAVPTPASESQINMLKTMLQELVDIGIPNVRVPSDTFFKSLDTRSASEWITRTNTLRSSNFDLLPPTETQLERLVEFYLFPDVEWETYNVNIKVFKDTYSAWVTEEVTDEFVDFGGFLIPRSRKISGSFIGESNWRHMTKEEFTDELRKKLTHSTASLILNRYRSAYRDYLNTRLSLGQKNQIREEEKRLASLYVPNSQTDVSLDVPFSIHDSEGKGIEVQETPFALTSDDDFIIQPLSRHQWNPVAYVPLPENVLSLFSREEADRYIAQLQYERQWAVVRNVSGANNLDYPDATIENARSIEDDVKSKEVEFKALNSFLYDLTAIVGLEFEYNDYTVDALRHEATQVFFSPNAVKTQEELRSEIKHYIRHAVRKNAIKFTGLMDLCERSYVANELLDELCEVNDFCKELINLQRIQY